MISNIKILFFFIFILSGKYIIEISNYHVQVRYILLLPLTVMTAYLMKEIKFKFDLILIAILFFCSTLIGSVFWNLDGSYALEYFVDLIIILSIVIFVPAVLKNNDDLEYFLFLFVLTGLIYSILSILSVFSGTRDSLLLGGPNVTVRLIFLGLLSYLHIRKNLKINIQLIIILMAGVVATGSRGGIISASICFLLYFIINLKSNLKSIKLTFFMCVNIVFTFLILFYGYNNFKDEVDLLIRSRIIETIVEDLHFAGRDGLILLSLNEIQQNLFFGHGLAKYYDNAIGFHPHNLFIQLYLDIGMISFINFGIIIFALVSCALNRDKIIFYTIPFYLIVHMVSGTYYDLRYMFIFWIVSNLTLKLDNDGLGRTRRIYKKVFSKNTRSARLHQLHS